MSFIEDQKWRYATKKFDASKKITAKNLEIIKEGVQLSASSYGLQLYKVLIVTNTETRALLKSASWGQSQVEDASHLIVFCNYSDVNEEHLAEFVKLKAKVQNLEEEKLGGYTKFILSQLNELNHQEFNAWAAKQTYLALGNLMNVCANLKIDTCPMEGFDTEKYNEILGLNKRGLSAALVCPIGYRSEEDASQHAPKVRKELKDLFEVV